MPTQTRVNKILLFALYQNKKLSTYKISRLLGYSQSFIHNSLREYKIPVISNSERYKGKPGRPHTKESRLKLSQSKLGDKNPMKRIEVRMKVSQANKGRKHSKQARERMSKSQKGRVIKWGTKISKVKKQWYTSNQGQEFIKKLKQRTGSKNPMFSKSTEIKERHWTKLWNADRKEQIKNVFRAKRMLQYFPTKATKIEKIMGDELKKRNICFIMHYPILGICQPDIVIPNCKLAIQCDGDWWHANKKIYHHNSLNKIQKNNVKRDKYQDRKLKEKGWHVMRFWGSEIKEDISDCVNKIEKFLTLKKGK